MKLAFLLGAAPIALGTAALAFREIDYETPEREMEVGPVSARMSARTHVDIPAAVGAALIGAGAGIIVAAWALHRTREAFREE